MYYYKPFSEDDFSESSDLKILLPTTIYIKDFDTDLYYLGIIVKMSTKNLTILSNDIKFKKGNVHELIKRDYLINFCLNGKYNQNIPIKINSILPARHEYECLLNCSFLHLSNTLRTLINRLIFYETNKEQF